MTFLKLFMLAAAAVIPVYAGQGPSKPTQPAAQPITVYRTATCGCCAKWVDHLKESGFDPTVHIVQSTSAAPPAKDVPASLRSCHTATLEGYTIEGHVPADVIRRLLKERPKIRGIAVPGMPAGSPGMESLYPVPYEVIAYDASGDRVVFARIGEKR